MRPKDIFALLRPLKLRVMGMIGRGLITLVDDSKRMQSVQFQGLGSETSDRIERVQNYGFTSVPKKPEESGKGAECIIVAIGGDKSHEVVIVVDDRRFRFRADADAGMKEGEVAIYDDLGQYVHLTRDGIIVEASNIKMGKAATKAVARVGDSVDSAASLASWRTAVDLAIGVMAIPFNVSPPGTPVVSLGTGSVVPTSSPSAVGTGVVASGSSVLKAVD